MRYIYDFSWVSYDFRSLLVLLEDRLTISYNSKFVFILNTIIVYYIVCYCYISFEVWDLKRYINRMFIVMFLLRFGTLKNILIGCL